jgi:hypothetical protein
MKQFNEKEVIMNMMNESSLMDVTDQFVMDLGPEVLQDIDTPSFMRKEYDVILEDTGTSPSAGTVVEPDEKIVRFLSVIKGRPFAINPG